MFEEFALTYKTPQIELAAELKRYLHGFQGRLGYVAQSYRDYCNKLYEAGMIDEANKDFSENYMEIIVEEIGKLVTLINERDIPFVNKYIDDLEEFRSKHGG
ncbi:MAG: hypothetical protein LBD59_10825 [Prevotellaceae bacterium]|jgi:hypothetical protein|nr:hypothetical protein [Prevotellaceae bacterium]